MDNHARRIRYLLQSGREPYAELADAELRIRYGTGTADELLTPAQRRRIRHKRGTSSYARRRTRAADRAARKAAHWGPAFREPADDRTLLAAVKAGLGKIGLGGK